ncbi:aminotransferase class V-fold PLP-dependent enzyme [Chitinophaga sancti]|uniref:Probable cysteine desulfurase n=1 Tax=Chitinophaga sancti TaxID=1004 RepID=A0A1K1RXJ3_9BACT|nr:cysteine desulfurase [Chitinophaga sancti]WQD64056.1 cysteine desulfurase [Chitinophaga sancti]WQG90320.1 cysteine desulfurase [Chitinophaga sancti]SFW76766.1 cysteine desulfurase / selenocysteine lyase [Chitinophaga sancti]
MAHVPDLAAPALDIDKIRQDFPLLQEKVYGKPIVYLDNSATTQKPQVVLDTLERYYKHYNSNVHRGVHHLSQVASEEYEAARDIVAGFINAREREEVIFTKGTTDSINLVANVFGRGVIKAGDEVIVSAMEHHSNIVPWQIMCEDRGAVLKVIPMDEHGDLIMEEYTKLLSDKVKIVSVAYISNSLGTVNPVREIIAQAHAHNIPVLLDAAQAIQHMPLDVQELDADFIAFSGHKVYGPTGIGILYGKREWLDKLPPYQGGGDMIKTVTFAKTTYNVLPFKYEAGTPDISGAIALGAAVKYIQETGLENIHAYEEQLMNYAVEQLSKIAGLRFIGNPKHRSGAISFLVANIHPYDLGELLDKQGVAIRTGHHCAEPVMDFFCIPGTVRASFAMYTTKEDIDRLVVAINKAVSMLQ